MMRSYCEEYAMEPTDLESKLSVLSNNYCLHSTGRDSCVFNCTIKVKFDRLVI